MSKDSAAPRWYQRVLPVTAIVVAALALATVAVPSFRDQVVLSSTHETQQYAELAFDRTSTGTLHVCAGTPEHPRVRFTVTSHFTEPREVRYVITAGSDRQTDTVTLAPGRTVAVAASLDAGRRYVVDVRLSGLDQRLHARCPGQWGRDHWVSGVGNGGRS